MRFREGKIAVADDIKEIFHQVMVRQKDRQSQGILCRGYDERKAPDVYVMQVMTFGAHPHVHKCGDEKCCWFGTVSRHRPGGSTELALRDWRGKLFELDLA